MKKIFFAFILTFSAAIPSFAQNMMVQNNMMMTNNMLMMAAAMEDDAQQQQAQAQAQSPIVVNIQYQSDGTAVVTSSVPVQVQTAAPPTEASQVQTAAPQTEDNKTGEIFLALILGLFVGAIVTKMLNRAK